MPLLIRIKISHDPCSNVTHFITALYISPKIHFNIIIQTFLCYKIGCYQKFPHQYCIHNYCFPRYKQHFQTIVMNLISLLNKIKQTHTNLPGDALSLGNFRRFERSYSLCVQGQASWEKESRWKVCVI